MKKFWRLAFEGVANELEYPSEQKKRKRIDPEPMIEECASEERDGNKNRWNAKRMAGAVDRMLMAGRILRDPFGAGAVA